MTLQNTKKIFKIWIFACIAMIIHSFFDVLRDGYFYSLEIKKFIIIDWHILKIASELFLIVSVILMWQYLRKHWEFFIGILIVRWGACEYFWNVLDKNYSYNKSFMGLSLWISIGMMILGILLPSARYIQKAKKNQAPPMFDQYIL